MTTNEMITDAFARLGAECAPFRTDENCTSRISNVTVDGGWAPLTLRLCVEDVRQGLGQSVEIKDAGPFRVTVSNMVRLRDHTQAVRIETIEELYDTLLHLIVMA